MSRDYNIDLRRISPQQLSILQYENSRQTLDAINQLKVLVVAVTIAPAIALKYIGTPPYVFLAFIAVLVSAIYAVFRTIQLRGILPPDVLLILAPLLATLSLGIAVTLGFDSGIGAAFAIAEAALGVGIVVYIERIAQRAQPPVVVPPELPPEVPP